MIGIDWVAVVIFGIAYVIFQVRTVPLHVRQWVMAVACFAIAGNRLLRGAQGLGLLFVLIAGALGVQYAMQAIRSGRSQG